MNRRTLIVVALAGVCGISAMVLVQALRKPQGGPVVEKTDVVFAADDVKPGESISEAMLEVRQVPVADLPEDAIRKVTDAVGRAALASLDKGDMLREKKLAQKGAGRGLAALVRPGMRAFTIQTPTLSSSMAGHILPGYRVDVLLTTNSAGGSDDETGGATTTTLLQNAEILAVHTTVNTPQQNKINPDDARSVTLQVTPFDASKLDLGQNKGTLHLSLRNLTDMGDSKTKPATLADLQLVPARPKPVAVVTAPTPAPAPEPEPLAEPEGEKLTIRTLRGTAAGADVLTIRQPPAARKARSIAGPGGTPTAEPSEKERQERSNSLISRRLSSGH